MTSLEQAAGELQARLVGSWHGRARLWFEPGEPAEDERVEGEIRAIAGGSWVRHDYSTTINGQPAHGSALVGFLAQPGTWQVAWVDGFHTSASGIMLSAGPAAETDTRIGVLGSYEAGDGPAWGWRTEYVPGDGALVVRHFNVSPDGGEELAVQFDYEARSA